MFCVCVGVRYRFFLFFCGGGGGGGGGWGEDLLPLKCINKISEYPTPHLPVNTGLLLGGVVGLLVLNGSAPASPIYTGGPFLCCPLPYCNSRHKHLYFGENLKKISD